MEVSGQLAGVCSLLPWYSAGIELTLSQLHNWHFYLLSLLLAPYFLFLLEVIGIESKASCILHKCSTTEPVLSQPEKVIWANFHWTLIQ